MDALSRVAMPNGMVKLSPDNQQGVWQGGHEYSIGSIPGFSFRHEDENASPGYYGVYLLNPKVKVELTVTDRTGYQRLTFPKDPSNRFTVSLNVPAE